MNLRSVAASSLMAFVIGTSPAYAHTVTATVLAKHRHSVVLAFNGRAHRVRASHSLLVQLQVESRITADLKRRDAHWILASFTSDEGGEGSFGGFSTLGDTGGVVTAASATSISATNGNASLTCSVPTITYVGFIAVGDRIWMSCDQPTGADSPELVAAATLSGSTTSEGRGEFSASGTLAEVSNTQTSIVTHDGRTVSCATAGFPVLVVQAGDIVTLDCTLDAGQPQLNGVAFQPAFGSDPSGASMNGWASRSNGSFSGCLWITDAEFVSVVDGGVQIAVGQDSNRRVLTITNVPTWASFGAMTAGDTIGSTLVVVPDAQSGALAWYGVTQA